MAAEDWQLKKRKTITGPSPSEFNARITLEYQSKVPDGGGGSLVTWVAAANQGDPANPSIWAIVNEFQSDETVIAMQFAAPKVIKVTIRHRSDLKPDWRIKYKGDIYNIIGKPIDVDNRHRWLFFRMKG